MNPFGKFSLHHEPNLSSILYNLLTQIDALFRYTHLNEHTLNPWLSKFSIFYLNGVCSVSIDKTSS